MAAASRCCKRQGAGFPRRPGLQPHGARAGHVTYRTEAVNVRCLSHQVVVLSHSSDVTADTQTWYSSVRSGVSVIGFREVCRGDGLMSPWITARHPSRQVPVCRCQLRTWSSVWWQRVPTGPLEPVRAGVLSTSVQTVGWVPALLRGLWHPARA